MNLEAIPKSFWHVLSVCMFLLTTGFTSIAYKAEGFSIKYKEAEFVAKGNETLKSQLDDQAQNLEKQANNLEEQEKTIEDQRKEIDALNKSLVNRQYKIKSVENEIAKLSDSADSCEVARIKAKKTTASLREKLQLNKETLLIKEKIANLEKLANTQKKLRATQQQQQLQIQQQQQQIQRQQQIQQRVY